MVRYLPQLQKLDDAGEFTFLHCYTYLLQDISAEERQMALLLEEPRTAKAKFLQQQPHQQPSRKASPQIDSNANYSRPPSSAGLRQRAAWQEDVSPRPSSAGLRQRPSWQQEKSAVTQVFVILHTISHHCRFQIISDKQW